MKNSGLLQVISKKSPTSNPKSFIEDEMIMDLLFDTVINTGNFQDVFELSFRIVSEYKLGPYNDLPMNELLITKTLMCYTSPKFYESSERELLGQSALKFITNAGYQYNDALLSYSSDLIKAMIRVAGYSGEKEILAFISQNVKSDFNSHEFALELAIANVYCQNFEYPREVYLYFLRNDPDKAQLVELSRALAVGCFNRNKKPACKAFGAYLGISGVMYNSVSV
ncbi:hypothetical protein BB560_000346 [Smittium megazygosporum]|uniref:Uncharacterized protein n=1 Tax=Smittium megazygosporum TaxID=133381 RepID=A0A2T9ZKM2_9FUNG|nr:hypothetical protein BB560_000346 [Smittium megazygosporum]